MAMHLDHLLLRVPPAKVDGLVTFLEASLGHMGFREHLRPAPGVVGLGAEWPWLWLNGGQAGSDEQTASKALAGMHVAFRAENVEQVHRFHEAALKAGGIDHGTPGPRPRYQPTFYGPRYYAAFVLDPECGVNFEVVYKGE